MKLKTLIGIVVAAGSLLSGALWYHHRSREAQPQPLAVVEMPPVPAKDEALPAVQDSDARLRTLLGEVTPEGRFHDWLSADDLLRRWANATDRIARDVTPRSELTFLQPAHRFETRRTADGLVMTAHDYTRFDAVGNAAASLDARKLARVYRTLHPLLESAYHQLGYPGQSIDTATARALQRLSDARVYDRPLRLEASKGLYVFADPSVESLGPVEKALLRMGPRNTRLVQQAAREIASALEMPLRGVPQALQ